MKVSHLILLVLVFLCMLLGVAISIPAPAGASGMLHGTYKTMLVGLRGSDQKSAINLIALLFGLGQILFFTLLFFLVMRQKKPSKLRNVLFIISGAVYATIFIKLVDAYLASVTQQPVVLWGPFPTATSWMLFGLSTAPLMFAAIYYFGFRQWIWSDEEQAKYDEILAEYGQGKT